MKKLFFLTTLCILCMITGCEKDDSINDSLQLDTENITSDYNVANTQSSLGEIIIKYKDGINEAEKQVIRNQYQVTNYKNCTCADPTLELWIFDIDDNGTTSSGLDLETVVNGTRETLGVEESQMNEIIKHRSAKLNSSFGPEDINNATNLLTSSNDGVTIAVLDTGIDYNYFGFDSPFLYNTQLNTNTCSENGMTDYFGWDFVNSDYDPFDDHGHATEAIYMMFERLTSQNINFQILPIKVFDENGDARYFDILCGFKYATNNSDVKIINMSFGWYNIDYGLLRQFITETQDDVLIITSAGNYKNDNDITPHYPSSYETDNILSIASWNGNIYNPHLSKFSNYGIQSVDIAAPGEDIPFYLDQNEYILLSGTSYSAAYTSAVAGQLYVPDIAPSQHIQNILSVCTVNNNLERIKYHSYLHY
ncbi:S8 family serine peptidase [Dokdonia sp.]|uniref:S8 family serine peptidase n=1 Tax=Dokdonia sp. TaxID=2024995 RepID=UPI003264CC7F